MIAWALVALVCYGPWCATPTVETHATWEACLHSAQSYPVGGTEGAVRAWCEARQQRRIGR